MHARVSGLADYLAVDEIDAIRLGRQIVSRLHWRKHGPGPDRAGRRPGPRPRRAARHRLGRPEDALRPPRGPGPGGRRLALRRVQAALRHQPGHRVGLDPRLPDRRAGQPPGRPLLRGGPQGHPVHPAGQPDRRAAPLPPEHHRLHGGQGVRAGRHHQARGDDDQRRLQLVGPPPDRQHRRLLRGRQLRHVRPGLRPPLPLRLAERPLGGDGPGPAGRRAVHRRAPVGRVQGGPLRRGGRRGHAGPGRGPDRVGVAPPLPVVPPLRRRDHRPPRHPHRARPVPVGHRQPADHGTRGYGVFRM